MIGSLVIIGLVALAMFTAGLLLGRFYVPDNRRIKHRAERADRYMRTINLLLRRNHTEAIEELVSVAQGDVTELEPYWALATLFRVEGDWERAIRVHQIIALRADGDGAAARVRYELGLDFRAGCMPNRAIVALEQCLELEPEHEQAVRALCGLYEQQQRYADAAGGWRRVTELSKETDPREAHLWAAAAATHIAEGNLGAAGKAIDDAKRAALNNSHVGFVAAELEVAAGRADAGRTLFFDLIRTEPQWAPEIVKRLVELCGGDDAATQDLQELVGQLGEIAGSAERTEDSARIVAESARIEARYDMSGARQRLHNAVDGAPESLPLQYWLSKISPAGVHGDEPTRPSLVAKDGPLEWIATGRWRCDFCGDVRGEFFWRCGECRQWATGSADVGEIWSHAGGRDRRKGRRDGTEVAAEGGRASRLGGALSRWFSRLPAGAPPGQ